MLLEGGLGLIRRWPLKATCKSRARENGGPASDSRVIRDGHNKLIKASNHWGKGARVRAIE